MVKLSEQDISDLLQVVEEQNVAILALLDLANDQTRPIIQELQDINKVIVELLTQPVHKIEHMF